MKRHGALKKLPGILLALAMVISLVSITVSAAPALSTTVEGQSVTLTDTDGDDFYEIGTADELYAFAALVNSGNNTISGRLTADIQLNSSLESLAFWRVWEPIGFYGKNSLHSSSEVSSYAFNGTFEGDGHTISGLYFDNTETMGYSSFIGLLGDEGLVQNLNIQDSHFAGKYYVGGVVGYNHGGYVVNCSSNATIDGRSSDTGGIVGHNNSGNVIFCQNAGKVTGYSNVGGIIGKHNEGIAQDCSNTGVVSGNGTVGGIVGDNLNGTIEGCNNSGAVTASAQTAGGVVGGTLNGLISDCWNSGTVSGEMSNVGGIAGNSHSEMTDCYNTGAVSGTENIGGVVGSNYGDMTCCYNVGDVSGSKYVGGVAGWNDGGITIQDCYNTANISGDSKVGGVVGSNQAYVINCYAFGTLITESFVDNGGIVGFNLRSVTNCYYDSDKYDLRMFGSNRGTATDCAGMTTAQFASGEVCWLLNGGVTGGTQVWYQTCGVGIPTFSGDTVYRTETDDGYFYYNQGLAAPTETAIAFANMTLGNSLAMNFAFSQEDVENWTGCYAQVVKTYADGRADKKITIPYEQWGTANISGVPHFTLKFDGVAAKEMSDEVQVCIYNADGQAISEVWLDSVRDYAMRTLNNPSSNLETQIMIVDLLNYGAAAQSNFGYNTGDLANNQLTAAQKALATQSVVANDSRVKGENYKGSNLGLESQILMRMAFGGTTEDMYAIISFTSHTGKENNIRVEGSDFASDGVIVIDEIVIADGRQPVTITVYNADGSIHGSATDSLESYIARMSGTDALYEMILKFSDSAYNFFH